MNKLLLTISLIIILFCSGSATSQKEYHQRRMMHYQKKVLEAQKKVNYHQKKVFYYQKQEEKANKKGK
jgi:hypothetical protein